MFMSHIEDPIYFGEGRTHTQTLAHPYHGGSVSHEIPVRRSLRSGFTLSLGKGRGEGGMISSDKKAWIEAWDLATSTSFFFDILFPQYSPAQPWQFGAEEGTFHLFIIKISFFFLNVETGGGMGR